jgi:protein-disulfide isomerase
MRYSAALGVLAILAACGTNSEELKEIRDGQREILAKLSVLEKKIDQGGTRPAAAPAAPDPNKVYTLPVGDSPFRGPADAPVVLTEFSDFQCPFCAKVPPLIDQVLKAYPKELRFVYKQFPLVAIHQSALTAARAALAAKKQGKFWEMHDKLFANQQALQVDKLKDYAKDIGLDVVKFEADMASSDVQKQIEDEMKLAQQAQVSGTPSLFVNGKRVTNRSVDGLKQMIDEALKQKS